MPRDHKFDLQVRIDRLERRHEQLASRVAALDRHPFLTLGEELQVRALKKAKLAAKDALAELRRA